MPTLLWDTTLLDGALVNGSGVWDTNTSSNWTTDFGVTNTVFAAGDTAEFHVEGTGETTTVAGTVSTGGLLFHTTQTAVINHSFAGGTLDFVSGSLINSYDGNLFLNIGSDITSTGDLTINTTNLTFSGVMTLGGTLTATGYDTNFINTGTINNNVDASNGASLINHNVINGDVVLGYGNNQNHGTINGALDVGDGSFSNYGTVTGPVTMGQYGRFVEFGFVTNEVVVDMGYYVVGGVQTSNAVMNGGSFSVESGDMFGTVSVNAGIFAAPYSGVGEFIVRDSGSVEALNGTAFIGNEHRNVVYNDGQIEGDLFFNGGNDSFYSYTGVTIGMIDMGSGNDEFGLSNSASLVGTLNLGDGNDVVTASVHADMFDRVNGGAGDDLLRGTRGANDMRGGADDDFILGRGGRDDLWGNDGDDIIFSGGGRDTVKGGSGEDTIYGGSGNDVLKGGGDADVISGGRGVDVMFGGAGADIFVFNKVQDFGTVGGPTDVVRDFEDGVDTFDLSAIDADTGNSGNNSFFFIDTIAFSNSAGELRYSSDGTTTTVSGDVDGDGIADFELALTGDLSLGVEDFLGAYIIA